MLEICTDSSCSGQTAQPLGRFTPAITEIDLPVCRRFGKQKAALDVPGRQAVPVPVPRAGLLLAVLCHRHGGNEQH